MNFVGYLKGHPKIDAQGQLEFANTLSKNSVDFIDFKQSFKKDKVSAFSRTLTIFDIKQSAWLYSQSFIEKMLSDNFLK
jgi:hypothetical protein